MALTPTTQASAYRDGACLYMAMELSAAKWRLAFSPGGQRIREKTIRAADREGLLGEIAAAKKRFGLAEDAKVLSCCEAGRDGFWIHRLLSELGIENVVVDPASMRVNRRARRAGFPPRSKRTSADFIASSLGSRRRGRSTGSACCPFW